MVTAMICDGVFMICIICIILRVLMNFCFTRCFLLCYLQVVNYCLCLLVLLDCTLPVLGDPGTMFNFMYHRIWDRSKDDIVNSVHMHVNWC